MIETLTRDLRYAARGLLKSPGFTVIAVLSLALGLGVNTALFSVVNAVLLRPLAVERPERLVALFTTGDNGGAYSSSSYPDFVDLAANNTTLQGIAAHSLMMAGVERPGGDGTTRMTVGEIVSPNYFDLLGVRPVIGRGFQPGDERPAAPPSTVISYRLWQRDFGGSIDALGKAIVLQGKPYAIVGVAPRGFDGLASGVSAQLWVPAGRVDDVEPMGVIDDSPSATGATRVEQRGQRWLFLTGRLRDGVTLRQARANLSMLMATLEHDNPISNRHRGSTVMPASAVRIHPDIDRALAPASMLLMAAVGLVLLVACSNLASMLLARATTRNREMAIRVAIGASRGQLVRQLMVESALLAMVGGATGLLLAAWATGAIAAIRLPMPVDVSLNLSIDPRVVLFAFGLSLATGLIFGLAPAFRASRPNLVPALKGEGDMAPAGFSVRGALVVGQMAMSMLLLAIAGVLLRSVVAASHANVGFDPSRVVYAAIDVSKQFPDAAHIQTFSAEAERRLRALPGVTAVARVDRLPFSLTGNMRVLEIDGVHGSAPDGGVTIDDTDISASYFETLGIPIVAGRPFDSRDRRRSDPVAIVNETAARRYWPGRDAVGAHFRVRDGAVYTVVGVAKDHAVRTVGERPIPFVHFAIDQARPGFLNLVVRTNGSTGHLVPEVRQTLVALAPRLSFMGLEPLTALEGATLFPLRAGMVLLGVFGSLALLLAAVGLYGVMAFNVSRRTREIGIRMALGAESGLVLRDMLLEGLRLVATGGAIGLVLASVASRALGSLLVGVSGVDPLSFVGATVVLLATAICATPFIPARLRGSAPIRMVALRRGMSGSGAVAGRSLSGV